MKKVIENSLLRFAVVGGVSTILDIAVYNALLLLGINVYLAGAIGFTVGFLNGYYFNSRYVFHAISHEKLVKYLVVSLGGLIITEIIIHLVHVELGAGANLAKLVAVVVTFAWNYILSKFWAFAK